MTIEQEAREAAEKRYPELDPTPDEVMYPRSAVRYYQRDAYERGYLAGAQRPVTDAECVDIANRAQAATGRSIWPSTVRAVLEAAREESK